MPHEDDHKQYHITRTNQCGCKKCGYVDILHLDQRSRHFGSGRGESVWAGWEVNGYEAPRHEGTSFSGTDWGSRYPLGQWVGQDDDGDCVAFCFYVNRGPKNIEGNRIGSDLVFTHRSLKTGQDSDEPVFTLPTQQVWSKGLRGLIPARPGEVPEIGSYESFSVKEFVGGYACRPLRGIVPIAWHVVFVVNTELGPIEVPKVGLLLVDMTADEPSVVCNGLLGSGGPGLTSTFFQRMSAGSLLPIPQQFKVRTVRSFDRAHEETAELHWFLPELGPIGEPGSDPLTWNSDDKGWGVLHSDGAFNAGFQEGRGGFHNYPKLGYKAHELGSIENKLAYCTHQNMQPWNGWTYLGAGQTNLNYPLDPTSEEHPGPIPEYTSPGTGGLYRGDTITTPFVDMEKVADVDNPHKDGWWCPFSGYLSVYCDKMYSFHAGVLPEPVGQETDFDNPAPFSWPATLARYDPKTGESKAWALSNSLYLGSFATARDPISVHCAEILADTFNSEGGEDSETCLFEFQSDCGHVDGFDSHCPHCSDDTGISGGSIYLTSRKNGPGTPDCFGNPCPYFQCPDDPDGGFPTIYGSSVEMNIHACAVAPPDCPELRDGIDYITVRTAGLIPLDLPPGDPYQFNGMAKCMTPNPNPCIGKGGGVMNCAQNGECSPHPIDGLPVDPDCGVFLAQLQYCSNIEYTMHVLVKAKSGCFLSYFFTLTGRPNTTIHP